jgi:hypothetical protein
MLQKPGKYGILFRVLTDANVRYVSRMIPYAGKPPNQDAPQLDNSPSGNVTELMQHISGSGLNCLAHNCKAIYSLNWALTFPNLSTSFYCHFITKCLQTLYPITGHKVPYSVLTWYTWWYTVHPLHYPVCQYGTKSLLCIGYQPVIWFGGIIQNDIRSICIVALM